jgi:hypothetical protein
MAGTHVPADRTIVKTKHRSEPRSNHREVRIGASSFLLREPRTCHDPLVTLVESAEVLVASGRPVETAFIALAEKSVGGRLIDDALAAAVRSYALGDAALSGARR